MARRLLCLILALLAVQCALAQPRPEMRAIWMSRFEWPSSNPDTAKANIDNAINNMVANHFNVLLFQVRGQCDVHYPSPYEPWATNYGWTDPGWDPLQYAIEKAHANGIELHAYINTHSLAAGVPPANTTPIHPYHLHGPNVPLSQSWVIRDQSGQTYTSDNYTWISPGIPEASAWIRQAVMHVVKNYDVDGVHFDRIRTPSPDYSYDPISVARFNGVGNPDNLAWADFMRSQITRDLRNIYGEIQLVKPKVKVSAAPFGIVYKDATTSYTGTGTQSYHSWYQDSWGWMNSHVVDFMVPQIYWNIGSAHPFEKLLYDWMQRTGGRYVVAGSTTGEGSETAANMVAEYQETVAQNAAGHCTFSMGSMTNYWSAYRTAFGDQPTTVPEMPWKTNPTTGYIVGHVKNHSGQPLLDVKINMTGDSYNYLSAYDGFYAILDVPANTPLTVTAGRLGVKQQSVSGVTVLPGEVKVVDFTAADSLGTIQMDKDIYGLGDSIQITVKDEDLIGSGTVDVMVRSTSEAAGELVTLDETTSPGVFKGTAKILFRTPIASNGILEVAAGDTIEALYTDADTGSGASAVATATAQAVSVPDLVFESRIPVVGSATVYEEYLGPATGAWGPTSAKSTAPGCTAGIGSRFIGTNGLGAYAIYRPVITIPGLYDVYVTIPGTSNSNIHSPGAGFDVAGVQGTVSGLVDLSKYNSGITGKWYKLADDVEFGFGQGGSIKFTNNHTGTLDSGNRFVMDAVKLVFQGQAMDSAGEIAMDRPSYKPGATVLVHVEDGDLVGGAPFSVTLSSDTEPTGESLLLTESATVPGQFLGTIATGTGAAASDGVLQVANGDTITATYNDLDDGSGNPAVATDTALVDGQVPIISNVAFPTVSYSSVHVTFDTDEPCTVSIHYGTDCGSLTSSFVSGVFATTHDILLSNLAPATTYSLAIHASDAAGNEVIADNSGSCYKVTTLGLPHPPFFDGFESGQVAFPWVVTGTGTYRTRAITTETPKTGTYHMVMDSSTNGSNARNEATLNLDLAGYEDVVLSFDALALNEETHAPATNPFTGGADFDGVAISADGGTTWYEVQALRSPWNYSYTYTNFTVNLDAAIAQYGLSYNTQFKIRFNQYDNYQAPTDGIAIDNVSVQGAIKDDLAITPLTYLSSVGPVGGPFAPDSTTYTLSNGGQAALNWTAVVDLPWITLSSTGGTLGVAESTDVGVAINAAAATLGEGSYQATITFTNSGTGATRVRVVSLLVKNPPPPATPLFPPDGATGVPVFPVMQWTSTPDTQSYDVYLGTTNPPPFYTNMTATAFYAGVNSYGMLDPDTTYYWRINPKNQGGVTQGPVWSFTTAVKEREYFAEWFSGTPFDLANQSLTFKPDGSGSYYAACRTASITSWYTDPAGGTPLPLSDDSSFRVNITGGKTFPFYGVDYSYFFVGSNGYLTFGSGDSSYYEHLYYHFASYPRISALFKDLVPTSLNTSWKQLEDRIAITSINVPDYSNNLVSFQIELFFDGMIRITYGNVTITNGVVGLSRGTGVPNDFAQNDLSAIDTCHAPATPTNLRATTIQQTAIVLGWDDNSDNETTFVLERDTGSGFEVLATLPPNTNSYVHSGLTADTDYSYRLRAEGLWGVSPYTDVLGVHTLPYPPVAPSGLSATTFSQTEIALQWTNEATNATSFSIQRRAEGAGSFTDLAEVAVTSPNPQTFVDSTAEADQLYTYRVLARNSGGDSAFSNEASARSLPYPPGTPGTLAATVLSQTAVALAWGDAGNETEYEIERRTEGTNYVLLAQVPADQTTYADTGLTTNTWYCYRVRGTNLGGQSPFTNVAEATTLPEPPHGPITLSIASVSAASVGLSWTEICNDEMGFSIERRSGDGDFAQVGWVGENVTSYTDDTVVSGTLYYYRVAAYNTGGRGDCSNEVNTLLPISFGCGWDGWTLSGPSTPTVGGDFDPQLDALRLTVGKSSQLRNLGWVSPPLLYTNLNGNTIYRFKAHVIRSGQKSQSEIPGLRLRCAVGSAMSSILDVKFHEKRDRKLASQMVSNLPSTDPQNPTVYRVDLDPVDVPALAGGDYAAVGVHGAFEVVGLEAQENGSLELVEASLSTYPEPDPATGVLIKTYATGTKNAGDFTRAKRDRRTTKRTSPLPVIDDTSTRGIIFDSTDCQDTDVAIAAAEFDPGSNTAARPRVTQGKMYQMKWHVTSPMPTSTNAMMAMRTRALSTGWLQRFEVGGAFPTDLLSDQVIAQQALPGIDTLNPDKNGTEEPGVIDGGVYTMYFNAPNSVPASEPGPGKRKVSRRDIYNGFELIDTWSKGAGAGTEKGYFVLDRLEIREFDQIID